MSAYFFLAFTVCYFNSLLWLFSIFKSVENTISFYPYPYQDHNYFFHCMCYIVHRNIYSKLEYTSLKSFMQIWDQPQNILWYVCALCSCCFWFVVCILLTFFFWITVSSRDNPLSCIFQNIFIKLVRYPIHYIFRNR